MQNAKIEFIHFAPEYFKSFQKLSHDIQKLSLKKDTWFRQNPFDSRLHTHKLKGELEGYWSYYINNKYRVLFRFITATEVIYYNIGTHDIYR